MANPFAYEEYRKEKIRQKIEESRIQRVQVKVEDSGKMSRDLCVICSCLFYGLTLDPSSCFLYL